MESREYCIPAYRHLHYSKSYVLVTFSLVSRLSHTCALTFAPMESIRGERAWYAKSRDPLCCMKYVCCHWQCIKSLVLMVLCFLQFSA